MKTDISVMINFLVAILYMRSLKLILCSERYG